MDTAIITLAHISDSIQSMVIFIPDLQFNDAQDIKLQMVRRSHGSPPAV